MAVPGIRGRLHAGVLVILDDLKIWIELAEDTPCILDRSFTRGAVCVCANMRKCVCVSMDCTLLTAVSSVVIAVNATPAYISFHFTAYFLQYLVKMLSSKAKIYKRLRPPAVVASCFVKAEHLLVLTLCRLR